MPEDRLETILGGGGVAVITGGANGIGLATAKHVARGGMDVVIIDLDSEMLSTAIDELKEVKSDNVKAVAMEVDVADLVQLSGLAEFVSSEFDHVGLLMNNAGIVMDTGKPWEKLDSWRKLLEVNLWGVINSTQTFVPAMIENGKAAMVINTGSKQGITRPPGGFAYNLSKAGVIAFTEALAYEFRQIEDGEITAHLLVPGFTYTGMISKWLPEKPDGAWTSEQVVDFMIERLGAGDFYILCPDNDVTREMDEKRIQWYADDLIKNRPALSRWHADFEDEFKSFMGEG